MSTLSILKPMSYFAKVLNISAKKSAFKSKSKWTNGQKGQVYLIGAGSGDPELLTIKAHRILQSADVIMVDWLVNPDMYQYFPKGVKRLFVGKKCGQHSIEQTEICKLMVKEAQLGKKVVRLKGGDPSIFGRLAEETKILTANNIEFAIIPGVTAASGCGAYAGIPLTHRDCAQSVRFVTASLKSKNDEANWQHLAKDKDTLVFYMGLSKVEQIVARLMQFGMRANMPIAIIDQGTLAEQQVCTGTLITIVSDMQSYQFKGPALIVVGEVVNKRETVNLQMIANNQNSTEAVNLALKAC